MGVGAERPPPDFKFSSKNTIPEVNLESINSQRTPRVVLLISDTEFDFEGKLRVDWLPTDSGDGDVYKILFLSTPEFKKNLCLLINK